jgi:PAS domain S-box-containing protein
VDSVTDYGIFKLDCAGRITSWNLGAERIKGYRPDEIIGRHYSVLHTEDDIAAGKPEQQLSMARVEGRVQDEGWRVRKDGSRSGPTWSPRPFTMRTARFRASAKSCAT